MLIQRICPPKQRHLQQLFHATELGDCKPSQLLRRMRQLLREMVISSDGPLLLPSVLTPEYMHGNGIHILYRGQEPGGCGTTRQQGSRRCLRLFQHSPTNSTLWSPCAQGLRVKNLRQQLSDITQERPRPRSPSPCCRPRPPGTPPPTAHLCWYHARFGDRARNCTPPCWKSETPQTSRPVVDGDKSHWPKPVSPTVCHWQVHSPPVSSSHWGIIPPSPSNRKFMHSTLTLEAVNNTSIRTYDTRSLTLTLGLHRKIFSVSSSRIERLWFLALISDDAYHRLSDSTTTLAVRGSSSEGVSASPALLPRKGTQVTLTRHSLLSYLSSRT